jgi:hypothetical protein
LLLLPLLLLQLLQGIVHETDVPLLAGLTQLTSLELGALTDDTKAIPIISSITGVLGRCTGCCGMLLACVLCVVHRDC